MGGRARGCCVARLHCFRRFARRGLGCTCRGTQCIRQFGGGLSRRAGHPAACRPWSRRAHAEVRPAGGHGSAPWRPVARAFGAGSDLARLSARAVSAYGRTAKHDQRRLAAWHSHAAALDRDGNRSAAGPPGRQSSDHGCRRRRGLSFHLRLRARRNAAGLDPSQSAGAPGYRAVSCRRALDLLDQNRRHGGARDELHAPRHRPDNCRLRHPGGIRADGSLSPSASAWRHPALSICGR